MAPPLTLKECARRLGVHYMTAYRYVRLGMLPADKVGSEWQVRQADLEAFRRDQQSAPRRGSAHPDAPWAERLQRRLVAGDEGGAWRVVEASLASGLDPTRVYVDVITPAMCCIGDDWAAGQASIAQEHRATAIAIRLIGRLSARFTHRGRARGTIVIGTPEGEGHALGVIMVADMLRGAGYDVIDLGTDLPTEAFVEAVVAAPPLIAVAISLSTAASLSAAERLIAALRSSADLPIVIGGGAVTDEIHARALGADAYAADGRAAVELIESLISG